MKLKKKTEKPYRTTGEYFTVGFWQYPKVLIIPEQISLNA
jgi:hypothetical protein